MTITTPAPANVPAEQPADLVTVIIDGVEVRVPKGTLVIRAAELIGIEIPRFCDHPLLDPVGACRQCLVEVEGQRKPLASCTTTVTDGMVVNTQQTSPVADKAQQGVMELLLINHPLDCPVCDKGGECPLQNQAMSHGRSESRFEGVKRTFPKPINISSQVLLDRERCVLCARCTRFSKQIAGDPFIDLIERGALQQVGIYEKQPFESYFSGNTIQICPVGALTSAAYRFRARPFDLVSVPTACEHCASGCSLRSDFRRGKVLRRLAGDAPEVNEEWNCDKGRFAFRSTTGADRLTSPLVRDENGDLQPASWPEAIAAAAAGLATSGAATGVLVGGRATREEAYAYAKFARAVLGTNDVDFRARPSSDEEAQFLAARVAGTGLGVTYRDLDNASTVLLAGFEPEDESPIVFLRLRKAVRAGALSVHTIAPFASRGSNKLDATVHATVPGGEAQVLSSLGSADGSLDAQGQELVAALRAPGAVILVGERLAVVPGALSAAAALADATGARLAWIPRRAGERGALDAGALPTVLPGGHPVTDDKARSDLAAAWGRDALPAEQGRATDAILAGAAKGALVVAGVDPVDLADPAAAVAGISAAKFVVSLEVRSSVVTDLADVVLPVPPVAEKSGTFVDWEGRERPFDVVLDTPTMNEVRVLAAIADELVAEGAAPVGLGFSTIEAAGDELAALSAATDSRIATPDVAAAAAPAPAAGEAVLATWRHLLDLGRGQDGEGALAGTAPRTVARLSAATAAAIGVSEGADVTVTTDAGSITAPLVITDLPDGVVWLPTHSAGSSVTASLRAHHGSIVRLRASETSATASSAGGVA
jgi:NADH-quinone oxidoreductase subunit G